MKRDIRAEVAALDEQIMQLIKKRNSMIEEGKETGVGNLEEVPPFASIVYGRGTAYEFIPADMIQAPAIVVEQEK